MAYNDYLDSSSGDGAALIPEEYAAEIIKDTVETGWIFNLARRLPNIPVNQERMPVVSGLITAGFIDSSGGEAGLIPTSEMTWQDKYVTAGKLGVIVPLTAEVLDDSAFPIWEEVQEGIVEAINVAVAKAVLYGTGAPTAWTTDLGDDEGIVGFATTASQTTTVDAHDDAYGAIFGESSDDAADGLVGLLETDGFYPTAFVGHPSFRTTLRNTRTADGDLIFPMGASLNDIAGTPAQWPTDGSVSNASSRLIAGDWSKLVYAFRTDMRFTMLREGVIQDAAGNITINLAQQDMQAMRLVVRVGFAMPNPINRMQGTESDRSPFAVLTA
jgi:HK97 family phage major capsid protein